MSMQGNYQGYSSGLKAKIRKIRLLVFDVDGVLTDGGIILGSGGQEFKKFNVQDGMGLTLARKANLKTAIITGRRSEAVERRAGELHIDATYQGRENKVTAWTELLDSFGFDDEQACYMGDDLLDLSLIRRAGVACSPANATLDVRKAADLVTRSRGGNGAVRELIETVLHIQDKWQDLLKLYIDENHHKK